MVASSAALHGCGSIFIQWSRSRRDRNFFWPIFPVSEKTSGIWVFDPAYRCGAVPDSHRIPFRRSPWETPPAIDAQHKGLFTACQSKCCGLWRTKTAGAGLRDIVGAHIDRDEPDRVVHPFQRICDPAVVLPARNGVGIQPELQKSLQARLEIQQLELIPEPVG